MHETRVHGARGPGDRARARHVHIRVCVRPYRRDDGRKVDNGIHFPKGVDQGTCFERRRDGDHVRMQGLPEAGAETRIRSSMIGHRSRGAHNRAHVEAAHGEVRGEMATDEAGRAGHRHAARHVTTSAF